MRSNDRDNTACPEQEPFTVRLLKGVSRFGADLGRVPVHEGILSHAAAHHTREM